MIFGKKRENKTREHIRSDIQEVVLGEMRCTLLAFGNELRKVFLEKGSMEFVDIDQIEDKVRRDREEDIQKMIHE